MYLVHSWSLMNSCTNKRFNFWEDRNKIKNIQNGPDPIQSINHKNINPNTHIVISPFGCSGGNRRSRLLGRPGRPPPPRNRSPRPPATSCRAGSLHVVGWGLRVPGKFSHTHTAELVGQDTKGCLTKQLWTVLNNYNTFCGRHPQPGKGSPSVPNGHGASNPGTPCSPFSPRSPFRPRFPSGPESPLMPRSPRGPSWPGIPSVPGRPGSPRSPFVPVSPWAP